MIKIMIADDEESVRKGMALLIPFEKMGMDLFFCADNGKQAFEYILQNPVDIVITDIKMPLIDGITLIQKTSEIPFPPHFVLLTGYSDFEYAQTAMKYGVRHYLLKPCTEEQISEVLLDLKKEILGHHSQKRLPESLNGFLMHYLSSQSCTEKDIAYYQNLLCPDKESLCLILLQLEEGHSSLSLFALQNISEEMFSSFQPIHSILWNEQLLLFSSLEEKEILDILKKLYDYFFQYFHHQIRITVSIHGNFSELPLLYRDVRNNSSFHYYTSPEVIITPEQAEIYGKNTNFHLNEQNTSDMQKLKEYIQHLDTRESAITLNRIFHRLSMMHLSIPELKRQFLNLYFLMTDLNRVQKGHIDPAVIEYIMSQANFQDSCNQLYRIMEEIILGNQKELSTSGNRVLQQIEHLVEQHLSDPELNLKWISHEIYMNENYLSKLFYKHSGTKFSQYLTQKRMSKAIAMIQENPRIKLLSLCEALGFQNNPPYFCTLFKRTTGQTISEYRNAFLPKKEPLNPDSQL